MQNKRHGHCEDEKNIRDGPTMPAPSKRGTPSSALMHLSRLRHDGVLNLYALSTHQETEIISGFHTKEM